MITISNVNGFDENAKLRSQTKGGHPPNLLQRRKNDSESMQ